MAGDNRLMHVVLHIILFFVWPQSKPPPRGSFPLPNHWHGTLLGRRSPTQVRFLMTTVLSGIIIYFRQPCLPNAVHLEWHPPPILIIAMGAGGLLGGHYILPYLYEGRIVWGLTTPTDPCGSLWSMSPQGYLYATRPIPIHKTILLSKQVFINEVMLCRFRFSSFYSSYLLL